MLKIFGSPKRLCNGMTRRELIQVGGIGALGLNASSLAGPNAQQDSRGKAKSCIFVFLFGSPPQHETFDPKPEAPAEIQGEMKAIDTVVPGLQIGEGLPQIAKIADRLTVVRSMTHQYPIHCCAYVMTGMPTYSIPLETSPRDPAQWPFMGSVVDFLDGQKLSRGEPADFSNGGQSSLLPRNIGLPWQFCSKGSSTTQAGPYGAFLGNSLDPFWTDFPGKGTLAVPKLNAENQSELIFDPHAGISAADRFQLSEGCQLPDNVSPHRFDARVHLLRQFNASATMLHRTAEAGHYHAHSQRALSLIGSNRMRDAIDVGREPLKLRARYGMSLFGQSCLAARRLVEAGARFVSVFWDPYGPHGASVWDTHSNHFPRLRNYLLPVFDQSYSALISDLDDHGLLDETLVICTSEHGRTPQIDSKPAGGARHHWSRAYSSVFAGGGIARGRVVGKTDAIAGDVAETPVSPKDMQATAYALLGFSPSETIPDQQGRPHPIAGDGQVRPEFLA